MACAEKYGDLVASMESLTFIIGGARSGKSRHAEELLAALPRPWTYIATAEAYDDEMRERIAMHRSRRGEGWLTVDAPFDLVGAIKALPARRSVLIDCLTLWLTNHMLANHDLEAECARLAEVLAHPRGPWFVVSNEVGSGHRARQCLGQTLSRRGRAVEPKDRRGRRYSASHGGGIAAQGEMT